MTVVSVTNPMRQRNHRIVVLDGSIGSNANEISNVFQKKSSAANPLSLRFRVSIKATLLSMKDWRVTCLVDLEWACSRPIEMVEPPYWLTNKRIYGCFEGGRSKDAEVRHRSGF